MSLASFFVMRTAREIEARERLFRRLLRQDKNWQLP